MMHDILTGVVICWLPMTFICFIMYSIGHAEGYDKAKAEEKEQEKWKNEQRRKSN